MRRFWLLMLCWSVILAVEIAIAVATPATSLGGVVRVLAAFASAPIGAYLAHRLILGPRPARRWWLYFRFALANWGRPNVIAARSRRHCKST